MKPLVLVGAGHSHIALLGRVERLRAAGFDITLVDPGSFWYGGAAAGVLAGQLSQAALKLPLRRFCADRGVHYRADRAIGMDTRHRRLWLASGDMLTFDTVSLDVGLESSLAVATGSHAPPQLWSAVDVSALLQLADALTAQSRGGALQRIAVLGAGARALEIVSGLSVHPQAGAFQIAWFVPQTRVLPSAPVALEHRIRRRLAARGIEIVPQTSVTQKVDGAVVSGDGRRFVVDHAVLASPVCAARFVHAARLPAQQEGLYVTRRLQSPSDSRVYAAGACASVLGGRDEYGYRERDVRVLAHNIEAGIRQRPFQNVRANAGATVVDLGDGQAAGWRGRLWWQGRALARRKARSHAKWLALIAQYAR